MGRKCLWSKATDQAPDAKTDIAFCGQDGFLASSDIRAANQDGAVRPAPWVTMLTLPPALTVLPRALSLVCAVLLWLLLEPRLMEMEAALVGSPPASAWAAPDKRCALPSTLLTSEHRSANDPKLSPVTAFSSNSLFMWFFASHHRDRKSVSPKWLARSS